MKQKTQSEVTVKFSPYGINGEYYVYDNELGQIPMGYGQGGTKKYIQSQCDQLNQVTVNESKQDERIYPLVIGLDSDDERVQIVGANGWHVAYVEFSPTMKTAQRIVTAVNMHDQLLTSLHNCLATLDAINDLCKTGIAFNTIKEGKEMIAKATNSK